MEHANLLRRAVDAAVERGATYVEARYGQKRRRTQLFSSGTITRSGEQVSEGWGLRVLVDGYWGFAASGSLGESSVLGTLNSALQLAEAAASVGGRRATLAPVRATVDSYQKIGKIDPLKVPFGELRQLVEEIHGELSSVDGYVGSTGMIDAHRDVMELITSEGSEIVQHVGVVGGGYVVRAESEKGSATRSFPHHGGKDYSTSGFEWYEEIGFVDNATRTALDAVALLDASPCPVGRTSVVLDPAMVGTVLHETVGHATELDRIIGDERDNFGSSFVDLADIGTFPYASPAVSVSADATYEGAAGSYGYDAEGVRSRALSIVRDGVLVGAMNSRESAAEVGVEPAGTGRAVDWSRVPMARMTNMILQPGEGSTQDLIAEIDDGLYIQGDATTDIDDNRELCAFGGEIGWRIRKGELAEVIERPIIYSDSHQLLRQADRIAGPEESWVTGILGCGKGQPWQFVFSGQGGPPARFRNVAAGFGHGSEK